MSIYFIVFFIISIMAFLSITEEGKGYTGFFLVFSSMILVSLAGLRYGSPDQEVYNQIFHKSVTLFDLLSEGHNYNDLYGEWGFLFLLSIIKTFTDSEIFMSFILACMAVGTVSYASWRLSPYPMVSIVVYFSWFYASNLGALRHALISALLLLMIVFIAEQYRVKKYLIFPAIVSIHKSGVIAMGCYFLEKVAPRKGTYYSVLIASLIIAIYGGVAYQIINIILTFLPTSVQDKLFLYMASSKYAGAELLLRGITLKQLLLSFLCIYYMDALNKRFFGYRLVFNMYYISTCFLFLFIDFKIIGDRLTNFLSITEIILIPMLLCLVKREERVVVYFMIAIVMLLQMFQLQGSQFYAYQSIL